MPMFAVAGLLSFISDTPAQLTRYDVVPWEELTDRNVSEDMGRPTLDKYGERDWRHIETERFVIHHVVDGQRIAKRLEEAYDTIRSFFGDPPDLMGTRKSHVYAFESMEQYQEFARGVAGMEWSGAMCRGHEFWFPARGQDGKFDFRSQTLNHEMTHLVFNRLFTDRVPTWLNEGVAEYFGMREALTVGQFRREMGRRGSMPLPQLFQYERGYGNLYGAAITTFYAEAAVFVNFLTTAHEPKMLAELVTKTLGREKAYHAIFEVYPYKDHEELEAAYERHRRRF